MGEIEVTGCIQAHAPYWIHTVLNAFEGERKKEEKEEEQVRAVIIRNHIYFSNKFIRTLRFKGITNCYHRWCHCYQFVTTCFYLFLSVFSYYHHILLELTIEQ
jgi:hypothetical protein